MRTHLFQQADFEPGRLHWDKAVFDPDLPAEIQLDDLEEDLIWAEFPNGVHLDVGWCPGHQLSGEFIISLIRDRKTWSPFLEQRSRSIPEMKRIVLEFVKIAKTGWWHENRHNI